MSRWNGAFHAGDEIKELKRSAILKEAGLAFSQRGYHNTTLGDVAKALKVSKGTLYNYFKDKQEILAEFHNLVSEIGERAFAHGQSAGGSGAQMLRNVLHRYIYLTTEELGACIALMELDALKPDDRLRAVRHRDQFQNMFLSIIEEGRKDGSIRDVVPMITIYTFMGAINWMPRWYVPGGRMSSLEVADKMTDLLLAGLNGRPIANEGL